MKQLIESIVHSLVDKPEEVQIKEVIGEHAHVLELRVAKADLGKVSGKGGAHASARPGRRLSTTSGALQDGA